jgi:nitroreductase
MIRSEIVSRLNACAIAPPQRVSYDIEEISIALPALSRQKTAGRTPAWQRSYDDRPGEIVRMSDLISLIASRVSHGRLVEPAPSAEDLAAMIRAAAAAPDHGRLRPWRFIAIEGAAREQLGEAMARALKRRQPDAPDAKLDAERKKALRAPLILVAAALQRDNPAIPRIEQILAVGAAVQNILLAAHALGYGAMWRTGDFAYDEEAKRELGLTEGDAIVGMLYIGTPAMPPRERTNEVGDVLVRWPA